MKKIIMLSCLAIAFAGSASGRETTCPECRGRKWVYTYIECDKCNDAGQIEIESRKKYSSQRTFLIRCPKCARIGFGSKLGMLRVKSKCEACSGTGKAEVPDAQKHPKTKKRGNNG